MMFYENMFWLNYKTTRKLSRKYLFIYFFVSSLFEENNIGAPKMQNNFLVTIKL